MTCKYTRQSVDQPSTISLPTAAVSYLNLYTLALVVHVNALAAGLLVAVVGQAHGGSERSGKGAGGLLAGAVLHVGDVLAIVVGDAGVVDGKDAGGRDGHDGGGEELEGRHGGWVVGWRGLVVWLFDCLLVCRCKRRRRLVER
jgi:hypothetical protein